VFGNMDDKLKAALRAALERDIPKSLDDIVRSNRDRVSFGLATEAEIAALPENVGPSPPTDVIDVWHLISLRERGGDAVETVSVHLLGWSQVRRMSWIMSAVVALDRNRNQARTRSGTRYDLGTPGHGEPGLELRLLVCRALNMWGLGKALNVLDVFECFG
jgi:hypothetical protein